MAWLTAGLGIWAAIGPLLGILLGNRLIQSNQRKQWLRDCRKEEFKELLTSLTKTFGMKAKTNYPLRVSSPEDERALTDALIDALRVLSDRIFIAADVERLDLLERWISLIAEFDKDWDHAAFGHRYKQINAAIIKAATEID